ncbi:hypothetical protein E4H12_13020 [Candidatus Thorarchaeota archaeon]|nr:MAG: hypothetical protein E4H12_13020 [Candidatus Thorarchaeota archaeon]
MPLPNLYEKYTDPYKLVEFRLFLLNLCNMGCKGCFYNKDGNTFGTYDEALQLSQDLSQHGYNLETCYLLPTDIFDNDANRALFASTDFVELISRFRYVGVASTLINEWDPYIFETVRKKTNGKTNIELQVNIVINQIFDPSYTDLLESRIKEVLDQYPDIVLNLAINVGFSFSPGEVRKIHELVNKLSTDKIVEVNFTFLYNDMIGPVKKRKMMIRSYDILREFSDLYVLDGDPKYNSRTLLRKPAFTFKDGKIYLSPIMPFDEFVFLKNDKYTLQEATVSGFLAAYTQLEAVNQPIIAACDSCPNLSTCQGKGFFAIANEMNLPCFLEENMNDNTSSRN